MIRQSFLAVRSQTFDVQTLREEIEAIARCFGEYLSRVGAGSGTKHRALGAVGKALQRARTARGDALLGYARRVHEQTTDSTFPVDAAVKLDEGLRRLDELLGREKVPARAHGEILDAIEYSTYYDVKRRFVEFQQAWKAFVRAEGGRLGLGTLAEDKIPWFGKKKLAEKGEPWKKAGEAFLASLREPAPVAEMEDPEED